MRYADNPFPTYSWEHMHFRLLHRQQAKLGNNTYALSNQWDDTIEVRLHGNLIARVKRGYVVQIRTAGWNTRTTRNRLSQVLHDNLCDHFSVRSRRGVAKVCFYNGTRWEEVGEVGTWQYLTFTWADVPANTVGEQHQ